MQILDLEPLSKSLSKSLTQNVLLVTIGAPFTLSMVNISYAFPPKSLYLQRIAAYIVSKVNWQILQFNKDSSVYSYRQEMITVN
jgi:hypothetical protein